MATLISNDTIVPSNMLKQIEEVSIMLWEKGWAESNAGNISVNISEQIEKPEVVFNLNDPQLLKQSYANLANQTFLITGTGKRMRDIPKDNRDALCLIHIPKQADRFCFPLEKSFCTTPSSELPAHLLIHNTIAKQRPGHKVIFHTHPNELIALTHRPDLETREDYNKLLMSMHPETTIFIPEGVGFVPYLTTGTEELARESAKAFKEHSVVIWDKHGCLATGADVFDAFDMIDLVNKSAQIYFMCRKGGYDPEGLTEDQMINLKTRFKNFGK